MVCLFNYQSPNDVPNERNPLPTQYKFDSLEKALNLSFDNKGGQDCVLLSAYNTKDRNLCAGSRLTSDCD